MSASEQQTCADRAACVRGQSSKCPLQQTEQQVSAHICCLIRGHFRQLLLCPRTLATLIADTSHTCYSVHGHLLLCPQTPTGPTANRVASVRELSSKRPKTELQVPEVSADRVPTTVREQSSKHPRTEQQFSADRVASAVDRATSVCGYLLLCLRTLATLSADTSDTCYSVR